jgi:hypothetical protein
MMTPLDQGVQIDIVSTEYPTREALLGHRRHRRPECDSRRRAVQSGWNQWPFPMETKASLQEVAGAKAQGAAVGAMMGNNLAITTIIMTAVALDPTGVLMKFNQILKVINKLYFININYGTRLTVFLAQIGGVTKKNAPRKEVYHSRATRGKFTRAHLSFGHFEE